MDTGIKAGSTLGFGSDPRGGRARAAIRRHVTARQRLDATLAEQGCVVTMESTEQITREQVADFLAALGKLSREHGFGLNGEPTLFLLEPNDHERKYRCDNDSKLHFD